MATYAELLAQLEKEDAFITLPSGVKGVAVFYSGNNPDKQADNWTLASLCVAQNPNAYTLSMTPAGKFLASAEQYIGNGITQTQYEMLEQVASQMMAQQASGEVIALVSGILRVGSYFQTAELPALLSNDNVKSINGIDRVQLSNTYGGSAANFVNVMNDIGPASSCFDDGNPPTASAPVTNAVAAIQADVPSQFTSAPGPSTVTVPAPTSSALVTTLKVVAGIGITVTIVVAPEVAAAFLGITALAKTAAAATPPALPSGSDPLPQSLYDDEVQSYQSLEMAPAFAEMRAQALVAAGEAGQAAVQNLPNDSASMGSLTAQLQSNGDTFSGAVDLPSGQQLDIGLSLATNGDITYTESAIDGQTDGTDTIDGSQAITSQTDVFNSSGVNFIDIFNLANGSSQVDIITGQPGSTTENSITFGTSTYSDLSYDPDSNILSANLTSSDGAVIGTLSLDTTTGTGSVTIPDGETFTITNGFNAQLTIDASPLKALANDLTALGDPKSVGSLEQSHYAYVNPTGKAYTVPGLIAVYSATYASDNFDLTSVAPGAKVTGIKTTPAIIGGKHVNVPVTNYLSFNADISNPDLAQDAITNVQVLETFGAAIAMTADEFSNFSTITTDGIGYVSNIIGANGGTFNLNEAATSQGSEFNLTASDWSTTTLIGNDQNGQTLTASLFGTDTLTAGNGMGDILNAGEGIDTLTGGQGGDLFIAENGLAAGSRVGGVDTGNALLAQGDISGATVTGIPTLYTDGITISAAEWNELSSIDYESSNYPAVTVNFATAGTYDIGTKTLTAGVSYAFNALASGGTTLVGASSGGEALGASATGTDELEVGTGAGDTLSAGGGTDTIRATTANNTIYGGSGTDTIYAGQNATIYAGSGTDTIYVEGGGETIDAGDGTEIVDLTGNNEEAYISGPSDSTANLGGTANSVTVVGSSNDINLTGTKGMVTDIGTYNTTTLAGSSNSATLDGTYATVNITGTGNTVTDPANPGNSTSGTNTLVISGSGNRANLGAFGDTVSDAGKGDSVTLAGRNTSETLTGSGDTVTALGSSSSTIIDSGSGTNVIKLEGNDTGTITGAANDTLYSTGALETLNASGGSGNVTLIDSGTADTLYAGTGKDIITGGTEATIYAGAGTDTINVGLYNKLFAGTGVDSFTINTKDNTTAVPTTPGDKVTLESSGNTATISGVGTTTISISGSLNISSDTGASNIVTVAGTGNTSSDVGNNDTIQITGSGENVSTSGSGDKITFGGTGNVLTSTGNGSTLSASGSGGSITLTGNSLTATFTGSTGIISASGTNDKVTDAGTGVTTLAVTGAGSTGVDTDAIAGALEVGSSASIDVKNSLTGTSDALLMGTKALLEFGGATSDLILFYNATNGEVKLDSASSFSGTLVLFASGDSVDLSNFAFSGSPTIKSVTGTGAANTATVVTVVDGSQSAVINLLNETANEYPVKASAYVLTKDSSATPGTLFELAGPASAQPVQRVDFPINNPLALSEMREPITPRIPAFDAGRMSFLAYPEYWRGVDAFESRAPDPLVPFFNQLGRLELKSLGRLNDHGQAILGNLEAGQFGPATAPENEHFAGLWSSEKFLSIMTAIDHHGGPSVFF